MRRDQAKASVGREVHILRPFGPKERGVLLSIDGATAVVRIAYRRLWRAIYYAERIELVSDLQLVE